MLDRLVTEMSNVAVLAGAEWRLAGGPRPFRSVDLNFQASTLNSRRVSVRSLQ